MAKTDMQRQSFRQLEWALQFSQLDLAQIAPAQLRRLDQDLRQFVRAGQGPSRDLVMSFFPSRGLFPRLQTGIAKHFAELASIGLGGSGPLNKSGDSSTTFRVDGTITLEIVASYGQPYRQKIESSEKEFKVYAALISHLLASGIVAGQVRTCPECGRVFLVKVKPQPDREFHCSSKCTNRATFRRYVEKQREAFSAQNEATGKAGKLIK